MSDSTVQVVGYWYVGEMESYDISYETYKVNGTDTTERELTRYEVDVTIKDSTASTYTIEWFYKNYEIQTEDPIVQKIASVAEDIRVLIKTDELGTIIEVVNWEEVRDFMLEATETVKKEFSDVPEIGPILDQMMGIYTSKQAIEGNAIKDAIQFYNYHGAKYTLGEELTGKMYTQNNYGGEPFDTDVRVSLDEINEENDNSVFRMYQTIDSEQLTDATYNYLKDLGGLGAQMPPRESFPPLTTETWSASRIHGSTGWIIYSIETREVQAEGTVQVEERIIEIK